MAKEFVERREGSFYLLGSRVPLAQVVLDFERGETAEGIRTHYPTLTLEQVYGAIAFYLGHKEDVAGDIAGRRAKRMVSAPRIRQGQRCAIRLSRCAARCQRAARDAGAIPGRRQPSPRDRQRLPSPRARDGLPIG